MRFMGLIRVRAPGKIKQPMGDFVPGLRRLGYAKTKIFRLNDSAYFIRRARERNPLFRCEADASSRGGSLSLERQVIERKRPMLQRLDRYQAAPHP